MSDINKVILIGRLTRDPELKYIPNGSAVTNFSLATTYNYTVNSEKKESVSFIDCVSWGKPAEIITQYCKKGQRLAVEGRLTSRSWEDQSGNKRSKTEITVEGFQFLSEKKDVAEQVRNEFNGTMPSDDIPF